MQGENNSYPYCKEYKSTTKSHITKVCFNDSLSKDTISLIEYKIVNDTQLINDGIYKFYKNGIISVKGQFKNKIEIGKWYFYDNSNVAIRTYYDDTYKKINDFAINIKTNKVLYEGNYYFTNKVGKWFYYDENGQLLRVENYKVISTKDAIRKKIKINIFPYGHASLKHGKWEYYENGKLIKTERYNLDLLTETITN